MTTKPMSPPPSTREKEVSQGERERIRCFEEKE